MKIISGHHRRRGIPGTHWKKNLSGKPEKGRKVEDLPPTRAAS
jgi:hypothetical protein